MLQNRGILVRVVGDVVVQGILSGCRSDLEGTAICTDPSGYKVNSAFLFIFIFVL